MPQYLSTDPNAGLNDGPAYLSTDPAAGEATVDHPLARFGRNTIRGLKNAATGMADMATSIGGDLTRPPAPDERMAAGAGPVGLALLRGVRAVQQAGGPMAVGGQIVSDIGGRLAHPIESFNEDPVAMVSDLLTIKGLASAPMRALSRGMGTKAEGMMTSALKVPESIRRRNPGVNLSKEALRAEVPVSGAGIERNATAIDSLESKVGAAIDQSPATLKLSLRTMPETKDTLRRSVSLPMQAADPDMATTARGRIREFMGPLQDKTGTPRDLTPRQVQDMKVRLGQMLANRFGKETTLPMTEMNQAIRSDLRTNLANAVPEVAPLNAELGPRYALQDALEQRVPVAARQNQLPMRAALGAGVLGNVGGATGRVAGAIVGAAIDNPEYLSRAAIAMNNASQRVAALEKTAKTLQPYATMNTFASVLQDQTPSGQEARSRGQVVTSAVNELVDQPEFARLSLEQQDQAIQQLVEDVSLLVGGTADVTSTKARSTTILKDLMASHATVRP